MNGGVSGWFFEVPTTGVGAAAPYQGGPRTWVGSLRVPLRAALQTLSVPGRCGQQRLPNVLPGGPVPLQDRYLPAFMCHHGGRSTAIRSADYDNNFNVEVGVRVRIVHSDFIMHRPVNRASTVLVLAVSAFLIGRGTRCRLIWLAGCRVHLEGAG